MLLESKTDSPCDAEVIANVVVNKKTNKVYVCNSPTTQSSLPNMFKFRCPCCSSILEEGEKREFETLVDHVSTPNMISYPLRETLVCSCEKSKDMFWDSYGDCHRIEYGDGMFPDAIRTILDSVEENNHE